MRLSSATELAGLTVGAVVSPLFALGSLLRRARVFHPDGHVFAARCEAATSNPMLAPIAQRLTGDVIVRLSGGAWRNDREWPDVLGCAVRFRGHRHTLAAPASDDQDLVFATVRAAFLLPLAFVTTDTHDYLHNDYFAAAPYVLDDVGAVALRLTPLASGEGASRTARLDDAVRRGTAGFRLELQRLRDPYAVWQPVAVVTLREPLPLGNDTLRFSPFRTGMGLRPIGFVHAMRRIPYLASQLARA